MNKTKVTENYHSDDQQIDDFFLTTSLEDTRKRALDLSLPLDIRLEEFKKFAMSDPEQLCELISCITSLYYFSRTTRVEKYLISLCDIRDIPLIYRVDCAKNLDPIGYDQLYKMFQEEGEEIKKMTISSQLDMLTSLMTSDTYQEFCNDYFCKFINNNALEDVYRIKIIQSLEGKFTQEKFFYYATNACFAFLRNENNTYTYRTLCCQYLLVKCELKNIDSEESDSKKTENRTIVEEFLLEVAKNTSLDEDVRADACDILLAYATKDMRECAFVVLHEIGGGFKADKNIFKNSQNVHVQSINESIQKHLEKISAYIPKNNVVWSFPDALEDIKKKNKDNPELKSLEQSLIRVMVDRAVYGSTHMTLTVIFEKVWTYIQDSEFREELEKRMVEELIDANNKCSSGFTSRMINSLSGFGDINVTISFEDQISANLEARLNAKIVALTDEEFMEKVLNEMTLPPHFYEQRQNFLKFFRECISTIREELWLEFHEHISDTDFDLYFRKALMHYEGMGVYNN